jgi:hypothetical protein
MFQACLFAVDEGTDVKVLLSLQYLFMVVCNISAKLVSSGNSICIFNKQTLRSIPIIKANEMHYFSTLFGKEMCMLFSSYSQ